MPTRYVNIQARKSASHPEMDQAICTPEEVEFDGQKISIGAGDRVVLPVETAIAGSLATQNTDITFDTGSHNPADVFRS